MLLKFLLFLQGWELKGGWCFVFTKAPFHIIYHQFTVNSFNTENHTADTNKVSERERERGRDKERREDGAQLGWINSI